MRLQAVFFDMGGTIDFYRQTREYRIRQSYLIRECLERGGVILPWSDERLVDAIASGMADYYDWNRESNIELGPAEVWSRFLLDGLNVSTETLMPIAEELALLYETRLYIREMRPEMPEVLAEIKALGLKIGIISNTQSLYQVSTNLKEYGIFEYFDPIILSSEYGRRKPDPAIFYAAARLAKVPTGACVFVGDVLSKDILGANRAGFQLAVQIIHPYTNQEADQETTPDAVIQNMSELLPILKAELENERRPTAAPTNCHPIKAIFFDAGDILYFRPDKDKNLNLFLKEQILDIHPDFLAERERLKDLAFSGQMGRHDFYEQVLRLYGLTDPEAISAGVDAMKQDDYSVEILDGVPDTIIQLKRKGYILGIITDTAMPFSKKLNWFDQYGFGHVWDSVISSKELGVRKPSPVLYETAIAQVGISPCEAVFVGHKTTELQGARAVGMKTIAFNYEADAVADIYLDKFSDLLTVPFIE